MFLIVMDTMINMNTCVVHPPSTLHASHTIFSILACKPRCKGEKHYFIDINNYTTNIQQKI